MEQQSSFDQLMRIQTARRKLEARELNQWATDEQMKQIKYLLTGMLTMTPPYPTDHYFSPSRRTTSMLAALSYRFLKRGINSRSNMTQDQALMWRQLFATIRLQTLLGLSLRSVATIGIRLYLNSSLFMLSYSREYGLLLSRHSGVTRWNEDVFQVIAPGCEPGWSEIYW